MEKRLNKVLLISNFALCLSFFDCKKAEKNYQVDFVDRNTAFSFSQKTNPLLLVIEINEDGKLSLNKIETGMIGDTSPLCEKLDAVFDDRAKHGITEREILIEINGKIKVEDLEKLIEDLTRTEAVPIRVIKNDG